jgi:hypothetical protein
MNDVNHEAQETIPKPAKRVASRTRAAKATRHEAGSPGVGDSKVVGKAPADPMERIVCITLHDSPQIPPNGQFVGVNGKQFLLKPGRKLLVPRYVCAALDNAVHGLPDIDDQKRIIGMREAPRLTYTVHLDYEDAQA